MEDIFIQIAVDFLSVIVITAAPIPSDPSDFNTYKAIKDSVNFTSAIIVAIVVATDSDYSRVY
jgi:hypothetical protein